MPRNGSGYYTLPVGNPVVDGTVIDVNWANPTMDDIALQLNNVLTRDGVLGPTLPFKLVDGTSGAPGLSFAAATGTGLWRDATQLGVSYGGSTVFSANSDGIATAKGYSSSAAEALTLTNAASAIVFRSPSNQEPPGVVLSRNTGDVFKARGLGGVVLETNTTGLEYLSNALTPSSAGTVSLGTSSKQWNNGYFAGILNVQSTAGDGVYGRVVRSNLPSWTSSGDVTRAQGLDSVSLNIAGNDFNFNTGYGYQAGEIYQVFNNDTVARRIYKSVDITMYIEGSSSAVASCAIQPQTFGFVWFKTATSCIVYGKAIST